MKVSQRGLYALKALVHLAEAHERGLVKIHEIAEEESIPEKFLESILVTLKNARLVASQRGREGGYRLRCDPAIGEAYKPWRLGSVTMWEHWDKVHCPTLLLRGMDSDLLLASTAHEMTERGPKAHLVEFEGVGHVPALFTVEQLAPVFNFLNATHDPA